MKELNKIGRQFQNELTYAHNEAKKRAEEIEVAEKVHVSSVGTTVTRGYEKLRNASENAEESLLLQRAVKRFYKRLLMTPDSHDLIKDSGLELITELTLAGYLENDSVPKSRVEEIDKIVAGYMGARDVIKKKLSGDHLYSWTIDPLSAEIESLFNDHQPQLALSNLAYNYFIETLDVGKIFTKKPTSYEAMLLVSVWTAILRIDAATIRYNLLKRYNSTPTKIEDYLKINNQIDAIFNSKDTDKLIKLVSRYSARFRVMLRNVDNEAIPSALLKKDLFMSHFESAISETYKITNKAVNRGIFRSIMFLFITKVVIGIAIEVPYDLIVFGVLVWLPLIVNLVFPPLYMMLLRFTLKMPGRANSRALSDDIEKVLYVEKLQPLYADVGSSSKDYALGFQIFYGLIVMGVIVGSGYLLLNYVEFNWLHLIIFYIFFSAASFLGFRLSRWIREIEVVDTRQNFVSMLRDFLYMPFVVAGQWINEKYAKIAFVSKALDMFIELPMKSLLRLVRRWNSFLSAKKDEL